MKHRSTQYCFFETTCQSQGCQTVLVWRFCQQGTPSSPINRPQRGGAGHHKDTSGQYGGECLHYYVTTGQHWDTAFLFSRHRSRREIDSMESFELLVILNEVWAYWMQASPTGWHWFPLSQLTVPCATACLLCFPLWLPRCPLLIHCLLHFSSIHSPNPQRNYHQHKIIQRRRHTERCNKRRTEREEQEATAQRDGVKDKEEVKERQRCGRRDRWGRRDEVKERQSRKQRERGRCNYLSGVRVCVTEEEAH